MMIRDAAKNVLVQLSRVIEQLDGNVYTQPVSRLGNSTIGQHIRHTLDFFTCLKKGTSTGTVNYDKRIRDQTLEVNPEAAIFSIKETMKFIDAEHPIVPLDIEIDYSIEGHKASVIPTNFNRELAYCIEHAVHHMAILKIGISEISPKTIIPEGFGIAASTLRYRKEQVQQN